jgi:uncharacterized DUF497 family protein
MRFEWDDEKNRQNLRKHEISFETAALVFDDPRVLSLLEREVDGKERWQSLGLIHEAVVVVVAHTYRDTNDGEVIRIISARKATPAERRRYEESGKR